MKIQKSVIKSLLKEAILELINDGQISLVNEIKLANKHSSTINEERVFETFSEPIRAKQYQQPKQKPKNVLKKSTGNSMFDDIINSVSTEEEDIMGQIRESKTTNEETKDYSQFVDNMHR